MSLSPLPLSFHIWIIFSPFSTLKLIFSLRQSIWAWCLDNQSVLKIILDPVSSNLYKSARNWWLWIKIGQSMNSSLQFTIFPLGRAKLSKKCLDINVPCIVLTSPANTNDCVAPELNKTSTGWVLTEKLPVTTLGAVGWWCLPLWGNGFLLPDWWCPAHS